MVAWLSINRVAFPAKVAKACSGRMHGEETFEMTGEAGRCCVAGADERDDVIGPDGDYPLSLCAERLGDASQGAEEDRQADAWSGEHVRENKQRAPRLERTGAKRVRTSRRYGGTIR